MQKNSDAQHASLLPFFEGLSGDADAQSYGVYYCIPASLRNVLLFHGITVSQTEIVEHHYGAFPQLAAKRPPTSACDRDRQVEMADLGIVRRFLAARVPSLEDEFLCFANDGVNDGPVPVLERALREGQPALFSLRSGAHAAHVVAVFAVQNGSFYYHDPADNRVKQLSRQALAAGAHPEWQLVIIRRKLGARTPGSWTLGASGPGAPTSDR